MNFTWPCQESTEFLRSWRCRRRLFRGERHTHVELKVLEPAGKAGQADLKGDPSFNLHLWEKWFILGIHTVHLAAVTQQVPMTYLSDSCQLSTEVWQNGVLLRLDIGMKFWLGRPCWCVEQNSGKLNCAEGINVQGLMSRSTTTWSNVRRTKLKALTDFLAVGVFLSPAGGFKINHNQIWKYLI